MIYFPLGLLKWNKYCTGPVLVFLMLKELEGVGFLIKVWEWKSYSNILYLELKNHLSQFDIKFGVKKMSDHIWKLKNVYIKYNTDCSYTLTG